MNTETRDEWIGVAEVAAEMKLPERVCWELLRRLRVPMLPGLNTMARARFKRADWAEALERSKAPAPERAISAPAGAPVSAKVAKAPAGDLGAWRKKKGVGA
jgi:hypothetical protein